MSEPIQDCQRGEIAMSKLPYLGHAWPFPSVNGEQTPESKALQALPPEPKQSLYNQVMSDPETEEALL